MLETNRSAHHFAAVADAVLDPIMGLDEAFRADPAPEKINLVVGVYQNERGETPVLDVVKEAEKRLLACEASKTYVPMIGESSYLSSVETLLFDSAFAESGRIG